MKLRAGTSNRTRWRVLLAAAVLVVLQVATVSHLVGHAAAGDNTGCTICLAANGSGNAVAPPAMAVPVFQATRIIVVAVVAAPLPARIDASYRARAPPVSA